MKHILVLLYALCLGLGATAQEGQKLEALRIGFFTRQLGLTADEAKGFWPLFDRYDLEYKKIVREVRASGGSPLELDEKILNLHKKWKPDFLKIISEPKFDKFLVAEKTWNEMLKKEVDRRKKEGPRNNLQSP